MTQTGRCLCGEISYEISGDALATVVCHCEHCQRQSGGAFSVNLVVTEAQISINGDLATYEDRGESGDAVYVLRRFCASCGSPILSALIEPAGIVAVKVGTLDDRSDVAPSAQIFTDHKQAWVALADLPAKERQ